MTGVGRSAPLRLQWLLLCALASALSFALAFPGGPLPWLGWVAFAPLLWALRRSLPGPALLASGVFGWLIWVSSIWWVVHPLHRIIQFSVLGAVALMLAACFFFAVLYAVGGWFVALWRVQRWWARALRDAALFTVANHWFPLVFPGNVAHSQYRYPVVIQVLDLGGVPLLAFLMVLFSALVAEVFRTSHDGDSIRLAGRTFWSHWKPAAAAFGLLLVLLLYGQLRLTRLAAEQAAGDGRWITVGAVQPNLPIAVPPDVQPSPDAYENDLSTALGQVREMMERWPEAELVVLPEWPLWVVFGDNGDGERAVTELAAELQRPLILNVVLLGDGEESDSRSRSSALAHVDGRGQVRHLYRKMVLVPGTEYWPWEAHWPDWLRRAVPPSLAIVAGTERVVFPVKAGVSVIPLICYEGIVSGHVRRFVELGGDLIVNGVNDSWFLRTAASEVHLAVGLYRTVEYRVPMVRVANSGVSVFVGADGGIIEGSRTELFERTERAFPLFVPAKRSPYARWGDAFVLLVTAVLAVAAALRFLGAALLGGRRRLGR